METLHKLHALQQSVDRAESPDEVVKALSAALTTHIKSATVAVMLDIVAVTANLSRQALQSLHTQEPQSDSKGCRLFVPLVQDKHTLALMAVEKGEPFEDLEIGLILALAQCAASALDRLSWPARPLVFRQLVENANVAIDVADLGGKITYANKAAANMYGFDSPDKLVGRTVAELYHDYEKSKVRDQITADRMNRGGWLGEVIQKHVSGRTFPVELALFGLEDPGNKTASFGAILQNVAEYHHLVSSLQQQTQRLEALNRVGIVLSSSLDRDRILALAAEHVVKLFNVDHCGIAIVGKDGRGAAIVAEYPPTSAQNSPIPLAGNPIFEAQSREGVFIANDVAADKRLDPIRDFMDRLGIKSILAIRLEVKDKLIGSLGLDSLREKREFTEADLEILRPLANQIALAVENAELYGQAIVANRLKAEFLATVSHELRTPLNPIIGYTETLLSGIYGPLNEKQHDRMERVHKHSQNLLDLINDVLDLAKIDSGKLAMELDRQDVGGIIQNAVSQIRPKADAKQLIVNIELTPDLPRVYADNLRLRQVLLNLLSNAVKFTREGKIVVRAYPLKVAEGKANGRQVPTGLLADGEWLAIAVEDTGIGIAPENFQIIFDAFRQVDSSSIREFEGTGLGLALARHLVEMHGGKLWVESQLRQGSTFTLALPLQTKAADLVSAS